MVGMVGKGISQGSGDFPDIKRVETAKMGDPHT